MDTVTKIFESAGAVADRADGLPADAAAVGGGRAAADGADGAAGAAVGVHEPPVGHAEHEPPLLPVYPGLQEQALIEVLPCGESALLGQFEHSPAPDESLYLPVGHAKHEPPLLPVYPGLQEQALIEVLPCGESALFGHCEHSELPTVFLKAPAGHIEQTPEAPGSLSAPVNPALHWQVEPDQSELPSEHKHGNTKPCV